MTLLIFLLTIIGFVFLIGLCIGSFLNVVIIRALKNESIVFPASKCPSCDNPLKWYHNIPVLSYLYLKGKCAFCEEKISVQYPIIELLTGILYVIIFLKFGISFNTLFLLIFSSLFIVLAATDIKEKIVFDFHTYILIASGIIYNLFNVGNLYIGDKVLGFGHFTVGINNSFIASLLGLLLGVLIMEAFARFGYLMAGTRAFGEGDTYIAAAMGAIFGWRYLITVLLYAFIVQIVLTLPIFIRKLYLNKDFKTLASFLIFLALVIIFKAIDEAGLFGNTALFIFLTLLLCASGIYVCKKILSGIKSEQNRTYLPFGPALVAGGFIMIMLMPVR